MQKYWSTLALTVKDANAHDQSREAQVNTSYLSPLSVCSAATIWGNGSGGRVEFCGPACRSLSLLCPGTGTFFLSLGIESSLPFPSLSLLVWRSAVLFFSKGDWGWLGGGVRGPFSGGGGEGGRPFLEEWLVFGLGWCADKEPLVGVDVLLEFLAFAAASAALTFFCLLSSAARLLLKVSVLGERLDGRLRERECRWRLRERECLDDEYGLLLRDRADRLETEMQFSYIFQQCINCFFSPNIVILKLAPTHLTSGLGLRDFL